jgi:hypothetical protein
MKTIIYSIVLFLFEFASIAQSTFEGTVIDESGNPVTGANVFIKDTYFGATTDIEGKYKFVATITGNEILVVSFMGFDTHESPVTKEEYQKNDIELKESINSLNAVTITAGSFDASDEKKAVTMRPLDILTTPSSVGDIYGAFNSMPGTQKVGEEGGLFVRGGEGYEAKTYMDGMQVQNPYTSSMPDLPMRGRFSPNLFTGTFFSTGGYSAEYGQALSSALVLKTSGLPEKDIASVTLLSVGANASYTKRWENTSLSLDADYTNLEPYYALFKQDVDWNKAPESYGGTATFRKRAGNKGLIKSFASYSSSNSSLNYPNYEANQLQCIKLGNDNLYFNTVYNNEISSKWQLMTGISYNYDFENIHINTDIVDTKENAGQLRLKLTNEASEKFTVKFGVDANYLDYTQNYYVASEQTNYSTGFNEVLITGFAEAEIKLSSKFATRIGTRMEYSDLTQELNVVPRASLARKIGQNSQVSIAYGIFTQSAQYDFRKFNQDLEPETASHYILNYQYTKNDRVFRAEAYYKDYRNLIKYQTINLPDKETYNNLGSGYAKGVDLFWRDRTTFKNIDYFISYSFIDTRRNYKNYPNAAPPVYAAKHNLSIVYKQWFDKIQSLVGLSYNFASGRPYYNPNNENFMADYTKCYNDLSMNISYLTKVFNKQTVIHLSVSNILGFENVYSYRYSPNPNEDMIYEAHPVKAGAKRFVVLVFILSIK